MRRKSLHVIGTLSLLLCLATCTLWVQSYRRNHTLDSGYLVKGDGVVGCYFVTAARGRLFLGAQRTRWTGPNVNDVWDFAADLPRNSTGPSTEVVYAGASGSRLGFGLWHLEWEFPQTIATRVIKQMDGFVFPMWLPATLLMVLPTAWFAGILRSRRRERGDRAKAKAMTCAARQTEF